MAQKHQAKERLSPPKYWFRPARFWRWFACYYPVSREGWVVTAVLAALMIAAFRFVDSQAHSLSDTLIGFAPWFVAIAAVFDLVCFRRGEYPSWWRRCGSTSSSATR